MCVAARAPRRLSWARDVEASREPLPVGAAAPWPGAPTVSGVDWLGEDLLLLALDAGRGRLGRTFMISYGLMGAELVRLAACGRIDIVDGQVVVRSPAPTGDADLDAALARIGEPATAGVICEQSRSGITRLPRWRITQAPRLAEARQRLDLIACSAGPVDLSQTSSAALACALGLDRVRYPGRRQRAERDRLREVATGHWATSPALPGDATGAVAAFPDAGNGPDRAAIEAATLAAIHAAAYAVAAATVAVVTPSPTASAG